MGTGGAGVRQYRRGPTAVAVGVGEAGTGVIVGVRDGVTVGTGVTVGVLVGVREDVPVGTAVTVGVLVGVREGVTVGSSATVAVFVDVRVGVAVIGAAVGLGDGCGACR